MPALLNRCKPLLTPALLMLALMLPVTDARGQTFRKHEGVLIVTSGGEVIGRERFRIGRVGDGIEAKAEIELQVGDTRVRQTTAMTLSFSGEPRSYEWRMKEPRSGKIQVTFQDGRAAVVVALENGGNDQKEFHFNTEQVALLDNNVFHHYILLARLYDFTKGGVQTFPVLVPQSVHPDTLTVEDKGLESITAKAGTVLGRRLEVITTDNRIQLWLGENDRLLRLEVPSAGVTVEPE